MRYLRFAALAAAISLPVLSYADNDRIFIVGDATPCGWDLNLVQAMHSSDENPNTYSGTIHLDSNGQFKFMTEHEWGSMEYGEAPAVPTPPVAPDIHRYKAPLYWSVYEYCYVRELRGETNIDISPSEWDKIIDWVARDLKPFGYDMICTDGFIPMLANDASGYMTHYGSISLTDLIAKAKAKGLKVGIYDNPLWIHGSLDTPIAGTPYTFGNLCYNGSNPTVHPGASDKWFTWAVAENPGCREFIDGFFKHYKDLGVDYIRMDFLSWYEDGNDRGMGNVGRGYGRDSYRLALQYIAEAAEKYGIFISLVMPHLYNDAELEAAYGNMIRIVADTTVGGWGHCSANNRGSVFSSWPNCDNQFDGFIHWSHLSGRNKVILDGDFIRLNTFSTEAEKQTEISLNLMAGGPVTVADQYHTIGTNLKYYTNTEMLELNADGFVGKPLSDDLNSVQSNIWYGQMTDGDYVVGIFNRDDYARQYTVSFADLGIKGEYAIRDLWKHTDDGTADKVSATIPAHGCKIMRLKDSAAKASVKATAQTETREIALTGGTFDEGYGKLSVEQPGNYRITVDTENLKATISPSPYQGSPVKHTTLYLVGDATAGGWDIDGATPLLQSQDEPYIYSTTADLTAGGSFKIAHSARGGKTWDSQYFLFRDATDNGKISADGSGDRQWSVGTSGPYTVTVNTLANTISITAPATSGIVAPAANAPAADNAPAEYYTLQGQKVTTPQKGLYIKATPTKASKTIL